MNETLNCIAGIYVVIGALFFFFMHNGLRHSGKYQGNEFISLVIATVYGFGWLPVILIYISRRKKITW